MLIGQTILHEFKASGPVNETALFTPWFSRQGNDVFNHIELMNAGSDAGITPAVSWEMFTKNSEDTGDGTALTGTGDTSSAMTGTFSWSCTNCEELVRYKITLSGTGTQTGTGTLFAHFRFLSPTWETTGAQSI